jgi:hypothetical protein
MLRKTWRLLTDAGMVVALCAVLLSAAAAQREPQSTPPDSTPSAAATASADATAAPGAEPGYVGTNECFSCHRPQTDVWSETKHASAHSVLPKQYQNDSKCLKCHVTGFGERDGFVAGTNKDLLMVGCESCHGPGSLHIDAAKRFVLADPGEEAAIEKEMRETIVKTPADSNCTHCHTTQSHGHHPAYEGQPTDAVAHRLEVLCSAPVSVVSNVDTTAVTHGRPSRYNVKTCGGCHYDQYKQWRSETHSRLASVLPAIYLNDKTCLACHTMDSYDVKPVTLAGNPHLGRVGTSCESCHGPALEHVHFNKRYVVGPPLGTRLEQAARDSIRKGKPNTTCIECHLIHRHKEHPPFEKP